jgi:hypothetical protein
MSVRDLILRHSDIPSGLRPILLAMLPQTEQSTLRDQFAMAALTGLLANSYNSGHSQPLAEAPSEMFSRFAYEQADFMLKQREEGRE